MSSSNPNSNDKKKSNEGNQENIESNSSSATSALPSTEQQTSVTTNSSVPFSTSALPSTEQQTSVTTSSSAPFPTLSSSIQPALSSAAQHQTNVTARSSATLSLPSHLQTPSTEQSSARTSRSDEESELSEINSNLQSNNRNSMLNAKTNVSLNLKSNQPKGFRFRVEDLKLNKNIKSKTVKLNRIKQNLKSVKNTNLKRNQTLNIKQQSITPKAQRRNVSDLIDMMVQFNVNGTPKTVSHSNANSNDMNRRQNRSRTFTFQSNVPYSQYTQSRSPALSTSGISTSSARQTDNQQRTSLSLGNRNESVDLRLLYIFEKLINLIDRFLNLINELRINYLDNQNNDILVNRIISDENNDILVNAISSTLPDRLANRISERFSVILAQELEKVFNKYFGDKKR